MLAATIVPAGLAGVAVTGWAVAQTRAFGLSARHVPVLRGFAELGLYSYGPAQVLLATGGGALQGAVTWLGAWAWVRRREAG